MYSLIKLIDRLNAWFVGVANACQSPFLLAVRLYWGWQFSQAGWGKLMHIPKVTQYFTSLGVPVAALNAYFISTLETVGGILLVLGLFSRLISLPLTIDMIVAFLAADRDALKSVFSDPDKLYAATPYTYLFASLLILFFGPGKFSLDSLMVWYRRKYALAKDLATAGQSD
jgi:putative oxidoreductase